MPVGVVAMPGPRARDTSVVLHAYQQLGWLAARPVGKADNSLDHIVVRELTARFALELDEQGLAGCNEALKFTDVQGSVSICWLAS
jgi:hypothetical protein